MSQARQTRNSSARGKTPVRRTLTQQEKILKTLATGKQLTVTEAKNRLGVMNLSARIDELRKDGFRIYTNKIRSSSRNALGQKVTAYRLDNSDQDYVNTSMF